MAKLYFYDMQNTDFDIVETINAWKSNKTLRLSNDSSRPSDFKLWSDAPNYTDVLVFHEESSVGLLMEFELILQLSYGNYLFDPSALPELTLDFNLQKDYPGSKLEKHVSRARSIVEMANEHGGFIIDTNLWGMAPLAENEARLIKMRIPS